jgi:hypothetical protein
VWLHICVFSAKSALLYQLQFALQYLLLHNHHNIFFPYPFGIFVGCRNHITSKLGQIFRGNKFYSMDLSFLVHLESDQNLFVALHFFFRFSLKTSKFTKYVCEINWKWYIWLPNFQQQTNNILCQILQTIPIENLVRM